MYYNRANKFRPSLADGSIGNQGAGDEPVITPWGMSVERAGGESKCISGSVYSIAIRREYYD